MTSDPKPRAELTARHQQRPSAVWVAVFRTVGVMSKRATTLFLVIGALAAWPPDAHAQRIPWIVLPLAASPIIAVLLSVGLGVATRSWLVGFGSTALVIFWVIWFWVASNHSTSDWLIWASIVALGLHSLAILWFIVLHMFRRRKARNVVKAGV